MPEILQDPLEEIEPDFAEAQHDEARQRLTDFGATPDQATEYLRQAWIRDRQSRHDVWQAMQTQQVPPDNQQQPEPEPAPTTTQSTTRLPTFPEGVPPPDAVPLNPLPYARRKVRKNEYHELWYHSREGCFEAIHQTRTPGEDAYKIVNNKSGLQITSSSAHSASPNVVPDSNLTWDQVMFAGETLARVMEEEGCPDKNVEAITKFFVNMNAERRQQGYDSDQVFLEYQAILRREWMESLGSSVGGFDIGIFSHTRFARIESTLRGAGLLRTNVSTCSVHRLTQR
ncbi:hypothetical protein H0H81_005741 [Sphagnurus paluster]|uniref:Uncharacterized protein n=1 Tax=Sphagnurus paluster TaxID=117069 RepID=A0A9P7K3A9_9AGAR|nr:hypothetical protein H0H81_005741 [Sphagnurus paluster]